MTIPTETPAVREKRSTEYTPYEAATLVAAMTPDEADRFCTVREAVATIPAKPGKPVMVEPERHYIPGSAGMQLPPVAKVPHPRGKTEGGTPTILGCNATYDTRGAVKLARIGVHKAAEAAAKAKVAPVPVLTAEETADNTPS